MLKMILIGIVVIIAGIIIFASTKPDTYKVTRSIDIKASPEVIFPFVNDLNRWPTWSPYEKMDPNMKKTYGGAASGVGSFFGWEGNSNAGAGRIEILQSTPPSAIALRLDMYKPFNGTNNVQFTFEPQGELTKVTWAMEGAVPLLHKVLHLFFNMDKMVGGQFEEGLTSLKATAETK